MRGKGEADGSGGTRGRRKGERYAGGGACGRGNGNGERDCGSVRRETGGRGRTCGRGKGGRSHTCQAKGTLRLSPMESKKGKTTIFTWSPTVSVGMNRET